MCADICVDIFVHMDVDVCVGMRKACKCPYTRALMRAHMCAGGRTPNPADTKLAGAAMPGRIPAKRRPLPPLYTENTVLFSMLARWIALVAHASHRHQPQPDLIPAGLLSLFITPFAYYYRLEQPRPLPGQHGSPSVYRTVREPLGFNFDIE